MRISGSISRRTSGLASLGRASLGLASLGPKFGLTFALLLGPLALAPGMAAAQGPAAGEFLTGPSDDDPLDIVMGYLRGPGRGTLGDGDLADWVLRDRYETAHNGVTHVVVRQRFSGVEIYNADVVAAVLPDGRLASLHQRFESDLASRITQVAPALSPRRAVALGAADAGLSTRGSLEQMGPESGAERSVVYRSAAMSEDPIPVSLIYLPMPDGRIRLAWNLVVRPAAGDHWWDMYVDAQTGVMLLRNDRMSNASYRVFRYPLENAFSGPRTLEVSPEDPLASPFGWHDLDGVPGADTQGTNGNNVFAQEDVDGVNGNGTRPSGGPELIFDFPLDTSRPPETYRSAAITNLFYWVNILHDIHYQYGFDEPSGNFQVTNLGRGGRGSDPVAADAQDASGMSNANFGTPPDGIPPRMQMFLFGEAVAFAVQAPSSLAKDYRVGSAAFGPRIDANRTSGAIAAAIDPADGVGPSTFDACSPLSNAEQVRGRIALIDRGSCTFVTKVRNAELAGAIAAIVANNAGDDVIQMNTFGEDPNSVGIRSVFIGQRDGAAIRAALPGGVSAAMARVRGDSDLSNLIMIHEFGHGISNRLTGGPANASCLFDVQSGGMGEGWSDWWAMALTVASTDTRRTPRTIGNYFTNSPLQGFRNFPYSTDLSVNPLTFDSVPQLNLPHGVGEVWAVSLWEMYWNLVDELGFDRDIYRGTGGNNVALRLVMDGLKLQPCSPDFIEARDAVLLADQITYGGEHRCRIERAFAKRGLGRGAAVVGDPDDRVVVESFDLSPECEAGDLDRDGVLDPNDNCVAVSNAGQQDGGGVATQQPDGIGDVCQCGNVAATGDVSSADLDAYRRQLLTGRVLPADRCDVLRGSIVAGDPPAPIPDGTDVCNLADVVAIARALRGLAPGVAQVCSAGAPPAP